MRFRRKRAERVWTLREAEHQDFGAWISPGKRIRGYAKISFSPSGYIKRNRLTVADVAVDPARRGDANWNGFWAGATIIPHAI